MVRKLVSRPRYDFMKTLSYFLYLVSGAFMLVSCKAQESTGSLQTQRLSVADSLAGGPLHYASEVHLKDVRQLTYGGNNAEAYWSFGGKHLIFQSDNKRWGVGCDQIFILGVDQQADSSRKQIISTGRGRTTCSYFMPGDSTIVYASTHLSHNECPPVPERKPGRYVWPIYAEYDIFVADRKGQIVKQLTNEPGYDAEAVVSPKGDKIVFTSMRSGDLELWIMNIDGTGLRQVTNTPGYDGGASFSPDGKKLVWRASRPQGDELVKYQELLRENLVEPSALEIFTANVDGSDQRQVTSLGKANWAPVFDPSGKKILFSSNHHAARGFQFNIFSIGADGQGLEQITYDKTFDSFPMFSPDGRRLAFCSNRHNGRTYDTNVFVADWKK
ncbi:MAG: hypothetical protein RL220_1680 [Bacteroidota bacterium]